MAFPSAPISGRGRGVLRGKYEAAKSALLCWHEPDIDRVVLPAQDAAAARTLDDALQCHHASITTLPLKTLLEQRYKNYRHLGHFAEAGA